MRSNRPLLTASVLALFAALALALYAHRREDVVGAAVPGREIAAAAEVTRAEPLRTPAPNATATPAPQAAVRPTPTITPTPRAAAEPALAGSADAAGKGSSIRGIVRGTDGNPQDDVLVTMRYFDGPSSDWSLKRDVSAVTGADGSFELSGIPTGAQGIMMVAASRETPPDDLTLFGGNGFRRSEMLHLDDLAAVPDPLEFVIDPERHFRIRATDAKTKRPITRFRWRHRSLYGDDPAWTVEQSSAGLGREYAKRSHDPIQVQAIDARGEPSSPVAIGTIEPGGERVGKAIVVAVELQPRPPARGIVVDSKGKPVPNAEIVLSVPFDSSYGEGPKRVYEDKPHHDLGRARTGADGRFTAQAPGPAPFYYLSVQLDSGATREHRRVDVEKQGTEEIVLKLEALGSLEVRILRNDGSPVRYWWVTGSDAAGKFERFSESTDENGSAVIEGLHPGVAHFQASGGPRRGCTEVGIEISREVLIEVGKRAQVEIRGDFPVGGSVEATVNGVKPSTRVTAKHPFEANLRDRGTSLHGPPGERVTLVLLSVLEYHEGKITYVFAAGLTAEAVMPRVDGEIVRVDFTAGLLALSNLAPQAEGLELLPEDGAPGIELPVPELATLDLWVPPGRYTLVQRAHGGHTTLSSPFEVTKAGRTQVKAFADEAGP